MLFRSGRPISLNAIQDSNINHNDHVILVSQIKPLDEETNFDTIYHYGTLCKMKRRIKRDNHGTIKLTVEGISRVVLNSLELKNDCLISSYSLLEDINGDLNEELALVRRLTDQIHDIAKKVQMFPRDMMAGMTQGLNASELANTIAQYLPAELPAKQKLLSENDINKRLLLILSHIEEEKVIQDIEERINVKVKESIDENQREYYLREKLRVIKEELGDTKNREEDSEAIREELKSHPYPQHVIDKVEEELRRYEMMPSSSSEANVVRTYIDWMLKTPWYKETEDEQDFTNVEDVLNRDHFGLEKPKERIIEHLAVKQFTNSLNAPIICLVGPPGVGKTSISKSIANALGREFVKASLGGVKDESEVRGHRRKIGRASCRERVCQYV